VLSLVFVLLSDYSQPEISEDRMLDYRFIIIFLLHDPPFHKKNSKFKLLFSIYAAFISAYPYFAVFMGGTCIFFH
jgi:hypothetical protein